MMQWWLWWSTFTVTAAEKKCGCHSKCFHLPRCKLWWRYIESLCVYGNEYTSVITWPESTPKHHKFQHKKSEVNLCLPIKWLILLSGRSAKSKYLAPNKNTCWFKFELNRKWAWIWLDVYLLNNSFFSSSTTKKQVLVSRNCEFRKYNEKARNFSSQSTCWKLQKYANTE